MGDHWRDDPNEWRSVVLTLDPLDDPLCLPAGPRSPSYRLRLLLTRLLRQHGWRCRDLRRDERDVWLWGFGEGI